MDYAMLTRRALALAEEEPWHVALLANVSALLYESMEGLNWAGFYLVRGGQLVLGPFQGRIACIHIAPGRGVCGTAMAEDYTVRVEDVHAFPGHIACSSASRSEIVVPLIRGGEVLGVLDIDSRELATFDDADAAGLEPIAALLAALL